MSIPIHEAEARNYSDLLWRCSIQKGVTTSVTTSSSLQANSSFLHTHNKLHCLS